MKKVTNTAFVLVLIFGLVLSGCAMRDDVTLARTVLSQLVSGRYSVRTLIDWPRLKMFGADIGSEYNLFKTEDQRNAYTRAFIDSFSRGFHQDFEGRRASLTAFYNWRQVPVDHPEARVVAVDCGDPNHTFLFFVTGKGLQKKVTEVQLLVQSPEKQKGSSKREARNVPVAEQ